MPRARRRPHPAAGQRPRIVDLQIGAAVLGQGDFSIKPAHFAERHALLVVIALGEIIVAIGLAAAGGGRTVQTTAALAGAFAVVAVLWWAYFDWLSAAMEGAISRLTEPRDPPPLATSSRLGTSRSSRGSCSTRWEPRGRGSSIRTPRDGGTHRAVTRDYFRRARLRIPRLSVRARHHMGPAGRGHPGGRSRTRPARHSRRHDPLGGGTPHRHIAGDRATTDQGCRQRGRPVVGGYSGFAATYTTKTTIETTVYKLSTLFT